MTPPAIRPEAPGEAAALSALVTEAFRTAPHADGTEAQVVAALRAADALLLSLVAEAGGAPLGHIVASPVTLDGAPSAWACLGPLAVRLEHRRAGIGAALVRTALDRLAARGTQGVVIVGDPAWYARFGLKARPAFRHPRIPARFLLSLPLTPAAASAAGEVGFHPAFGA